MRRRRLTVWLLVLLVVAHGARTADPHVADTSSTTTTDPTTTTTESMEGRGEKKFGDRCEKTVECGFRGSVCDQFKRSCQCRSELPVTNHIDKCGVEVDINGSCFFNEQCETKVLQTECKDGRCACRFEMTPTYRDNKFECTATYVPPEPEQYVDPTMIGILVAMALMFVIICVVLRLFSKARWRENRTIFNTPNPRLMNVSLLRDNKHPGGERRGSRGSNRAPSRQPSMASLRPQSPSASQAVA
ncbi:EB domain-containing julius seizure protein isoform X2 [Lycorma delicatula]|uniref:EB domain-containing julius seizure protein isoform X2 n=1 Tax=Lycorma delicatula TaxID=130591 RepID=UPI003F50E65C